MNRQGALSCADITVQEDLLRRFRPSLRVAPRDDYSSSLVRLECHPLYSKLVSGRAQGRLRIGFLCDAQGPRFRVDSLATCTLFHSIGCT